MTPRKVNHYLNSNDSATAEDPIYNFIQTQSLMPNVNFEDQRTSSFENVAQGNLASEGNLIDIFSVANGELLQ